MLMKLEQKDNKTSYRRLTLPENLSLDNFHRNFTLQIKLVRKSFIASEKLKYTAREY